MSRASNTLEAAKLISDWAKWLVTIETAAIALIGTYFTGGAGTSHHAAKVLASLAIASFVVSISAAAMLLATLPEITQNLDAEENIWRTQDSVAGPVLHMDTQSFAAVESVFFGLGLVLLAATTIVVVWR